jgi:hypothetical protein
MKKIFVLLGLITQLFTTAQGLNFSTDDQISKYDKFDVEAKGYATSIPMSYSLEKFVPPVLEQEGGTCV